jgi:maltose O-acetyltransferase
MSGDSERTRMLAGRLDNVADLELAAMRLRARRLTHAYNHSGPDDRAQRNGWLIELLGAHGDGVVIEPPFHCDYGVHIRIGACTFVNFGCIFLDCNSIEIGPGCQIAPQVEISAATHPVDPDQRRKGPETAHPVTIGADVWIGAGAVIAARVTIGDDTTIGAGSIVLDDIPPRVLAAGTPCRVIRSL